MRSGVAGMTVSPAEGSQTARISSVPPYVSSTGAEAVDLAAMAGLHLDPWQASDLTDALGERQDGKWAAFEVAEVVARQNGKGSVLEARQIVGLFLLGERLQIHTAHQFKTCSEHFLRVRELIDGCDALRKRIKRPRTSHGEEEIETLDGKRLKFVARSRSSARGFTADVVYYDEAFELPEATVAASMPTLATRPNPQLWYTSSAVDQTVHPNGLVLARIRARGLAGGDPSLAYKEYSADLDINTVLALPPERQKQILAKIEHWAAGNPGMGRRIPTAHIGREQRSMTARSFLVERLSVGDWPSTAEDADLVFPREKWDACADVDSAPLDEVAFALEVSPDRQYASVSACGERHDGLLHIETIDRRSGTHWVAERLSQLLADHNNCGVVLDPRSAAGALLPELAEAGVEVTQMSTQQFTQAYGAFYDDATTAKLRHRGGNDPNMTAAFEAGREREMSEGGKAWDRKNAAGDCAPIVAATLAHWLYSTNRTGDIGNQIF